MNCCNHLRAAHAGLGDPYFPKMGNAGYDAKTYDVKLDYDPSRRHLQASSTMTALALEPLDSFHLDFSGPDIQRILVNGEKASYRRLDGELIIQPQARLAPDSEFRVQVDYAGTPEPYHSPSAPVTIGWNPTEDGSYVISEPDGTATWLPVNDHPSDKAEYRFEITVPKGYTAVANGALKETREHGNGTTFVWDESGPMASYLATVNVGKFVEEKTGGAVPIHNFFPASVAREASHDFGRVEEMIDWFSERFGSYPFPVYGNLVLPADVPAALETQTRPVYGLGLVTGDRAHEDVVAHELAHHWFGNNVSVKNWKDIWLSEGFTNYATAMWTAEHEGGFAALDKRMKKIHRMLPPRSTPIGDPGSTEMFNPMVYLRGAVTLHALRKEVGDEAFFKTLRAWGEAFGGKNATTSDFVALASRVCDKDLKGFFQRWVEEEALPPWPS